MVASEANNKMMNAYKHSVTLTEDGTLLLNGLPFYAGDTVEVIILKQSAVQNSSQSSSSEFPLKGSVIRYDDPFEPAVSSQEWDALT